MKTTTNQEMQEVSMIKKIVDKKGRLTLGKEYAGKLVIIKKTKQDTLEITPALAIPENEAWLYQNPEALELVRRGLAQAKARKFSKNPPDLDADAALIEKLSD